MGRYQFLRLPFGIATAPEFFQREMLRILDGLEGTVCHRDDILVYGKHEQEHDARLDAVLRRLQDSGITLNKDKCEDADGKLLYTADVLSRAPVTSSDETSLDTLLREYELLTVELLPASGSLQARLRRALQSDDATSEVMTYCGNTWPPADEMSHEVRRYASFSSELSVVQGLLFKGKRLVIPSAMRQEILDRLHAGHQGVVRCRARARDAVWWPGIGEHIANFVTRCPTCQAHRRSRAEPLLQTELPPRPWHTVGMDIFYKDKQNYLVIVDYYSKFFELRCLPKTTTADVIMALGPVFACHGIPAVMRTDNGPQFASKEFARYLQRIGVVHVTSSPYYPQTDDPREDRILTGGIANGTTSAIHGTSSTELPAATVAVLGTVSKELRPGPSGPCKALQPEAQGLISPAFQKPNGRENTRRSGSTWGHRRSGLYTQVLRRGNFNGDNQAH
ncbi:uncharacterized protein K02A2.6-like [Ornithodoros turicata]|uniref:uncharacterized protein K02A2.6-like n=1 Tax=Ornithodoros turicata TaxID=34597 RepID=UPI003139B577